MAAITFAGARRCYPGTDRPAVAGLDLEVVDGEFLVLVGPSGCGKSTTLRMLAGLEDVDGGSITLGERDISRVPPRDRDIAMVFQNYALYPHMSVADNMGFALRMAKVPRPERRRRVLEAARMLGLEEYLERKPAALSGGQRQRVAMGRAIVRQPQAFCMDEPLSNLDAKMRVQTRADIARLQRELGTTTVYVTHDQVEAMTMGDRVAVMDGGHLQQVGTPLDLYHRPANVFVAGFIGSPQMTLLHQGDYILGVRPEDWRLVAADDADRLMTAEVSVVEDLGADCFAYAEAQVEGNPCLIAIRVPPERSIRRGDTVHLAPAAGRMHRFDRATGVRI